jgi:hypothetical protein
VSLLARLFKPRAVCPCCQRKVPWHNGFEMRQIQTQNIGMIDLPKPVILHLACARTWGLLIANEHLNGQLRARILFLEQAKR